MALIPIANVLNLLYTYPPFSKKLSWTSKLYVFRALQNMVATIFWVWVFQFSIKTPFVLCKSTFGNADLSNFPEASTTGNLKINLIAITLKLKQNANKFKYQHNFVSMIDYINFTV